MAERQVQAVLLAGGVLMDGEPVIQLPNPVEMRREFDEVLVSSFAAVEQERPELDRWRRAVGLSA